MSDIKEVIQSSFFGNGYITPLNVEIASLLKERGTISRQEIYNLLRKRGYTSSDITEELDRQWYASALRYIPAEESYVRVEIGMNLWKDVCRRIHDQKGMIAGQLRFREGPILDICRSDFQSITFKRIIKIQGFHQAPVMRWTRPCAPENLAPCMTSFLDILSPVHKKSGDRSVLLQKVCDVARKKRRRNARMWLVTFAALYLEVTPAQKQVLDSVYALSGGPVDWKGRCVKIEEITTRTHLSLGEVIKSVQYLEEKGIVRELEDGFTPTGQGYVLIRYIKNRKKSVTFAVTRRHEGYNLELNVPFSKELKNAFIDMGGKISLWDSLILFTGLRCSEICDLLDEVVRYYHE